jgi:glycosyltransferase involved in cell wall biosynthesis
MKHPLVSIITVVYNCVNIIEETILSVINQNYDSFEYIIIDGGSSDGTTEIIKEHQDKITLWISEPDKGIYDAMNKGIQIAKGRYILFINSGDILREIPNESLFSSEANLIVFPVQLSNGKIFKPIIGNEIKIRNTLHHQGCFYKKSSDLAFDLNFRVFSDFCLNQVMFKEKKEIKVFLSPIVAYHDQGGISNDSKHSKEIFAVVRQNFGALYQFFAWCYFKKQGFVKRLNDLNENA